MEITEKEKPCCSFCTNHGVKSPRQHQCQYKLRCICILCELTKKAQVIMCHQQRVWRHANQKLLNETPKTAIKGQKCDKCRNHLKLTPKSNHVNCPYKNCECNYCKLTIKRRTIMTYLQRVRRQRKTSGKSIQERDDVDGDNKDKVSLNQLQSLCNDEEVDMLIETTLPKEMESLTLPRSASPMQAESILDSKETSSSCSPTSHSVYRGNEYTTVAGKDSNESCNQSPDSASSLVKTSERRYSNPYQSRSKNGEYGENQLSKKFHISPFSFPNQQSKPHDDDDVSPVLFDSPGRNPFNLSTCTRNIVGGIDSRSTLNSYYPGIPINLQSSEAQIIPSLSPLGLYNYPTPHNLFLYNPYLEQNTNRVAGRQPIVRPEPINPSRSNWSTLPLSPFFMRTPSDTVQGTLSGQFWGSAHLRAPYPPNLLSIELYKAMQYRTLYQVKVPSD
ncbi:UNVERIFIED_CONTAM: hypothetical protein RMT77_015512 [Armadillidium vulgare]